MSSRKCKTLSIKKKQEIIKAVQSGEKKKNVAAKFNIAPSTLSTILKKSDSYLSVPSGSKNKRNKKGEHPNLEKVLVNWWAQCRANNVPIGGSLMREKAKQFAIQLGIEDFKFSDGWFSNFKKRHGISFRKICGESAVVDDDVCNDWINGLKSLIENYDSKDIFNADETGLYYKCLPDRAYALKGEKCHGGKNSKERVTLLLGASMDGAEKLQPLMIGKSAKPRCFKNIKTFPISYKSNKKAWMTSSIFNEWLDSLNKKMITQNRKILLFIDNCPAHGIHREYSNVEIKFLPANTTSRLQPLDKGIIQNFKTLFRKEVVLKLIDAIESKSELKLSLYDAMIITDKAWRNVTNITIKNCFRSCGFVKENTALAFVQSDDVITIAEWNMFEQSEDQRITFSEFIHFDDELATSGVLSDTEIISENIADPDDSDDEPEIPKVSARSVLKSVNNIKNFFMQSVVNDEVFGDIAKLENVVVKLCQNTKVQTKITNFFSQ